MLNFIKLMFMGGKSIALLNKVSVEMKCEAMRGQFEST